MPSRLRSRTHDTLLITSLLPADTRARARAMYHKSFELAETLPSYLARTRAGEYHRLSPDTQPG